MTEKEQESEKGLGDLPLDELRSYAAELGIESPNRYTRLDLVGHVRRHQELLVELDREALLDVVVWARKPVRRSASKEQLARMIATITPARYDGLSRRGLVVLARLRTIDVSDDDTDRDIAARLQKRGGVWKRLGRQRRRLIGWAVARAVEGKRDDGDDYQFLPEDPTSRDPGLRKDVENQGVVAGIAGKLRHVADDYIAEKLDEIESRIDYKLNEIDLRLAEWRDREVTNRLRIIKITLAASVVVALLSLGYKYVSSRLGTRAPTSQPAQVRQGDVDRIRGLAMGSHPAVLIDISSVVRSASRPLEAEHINDGRQNG